MSLLPRLLEHHGGSATFVESNAHRSSLITCALMLTKTNWACIVLILRAFDRRLAHRSGKNASVILRIISR